LYVDSALGCLKVATLHMLPSATWILPEAREVVIHCWAIKKQSWLVVSTQLKNICQFFNLPQIGMKINNI